MTTSFFPNDITISYKPGPNLEPVRAILNGWPTPLKFVSCFFIKLLTIGSKLSLLKLSRFLISSWNSLIIFFDLSSISFKSFSLKLIDDKSKKIINEFQDEIKNLESLTRDNLEPIVNNLIKKHETNFKGVGQPLRVALTGSKFGPGLYDIVISLGKVDVEKRLRKILN